MEFSAHPVTSGRRHLQRPQFLVAGLFVDDVGVEVLGEIASHDAHVERVVHTTAVDGRLEQAVHKVPLDDSSPCGNL